MKIYMSDESGFQKSMINHFGLNYRESKSDRPAPPERSRSAANGFVGGVSGKGPGPVGGQGPAEGGLAEGFGRPRVHRIDSAAQAVEGGRFGEPARGRRDGRRCRGNGLVRPKWRIRRSERVGSGRVGEPIETRLVAGTAMPAPRHETPAVEGSGIQSTMLP